MLAIKYCLLSAKLLTYLIDPQDTVKADRLGIARIGRGKRGGLLAEPRSFYIL